MASSMARVVACVVILFAATAVPSILLVDGLGSGSTTITVGRGGQFTKLQTAFNQARPGSRIVLLPGTYREKVVLRKSGITLIGTRGQSIIVWGDRSGSAGGTAQSATVTITEDASGFTASGITFKNDYGPNNGARSDEQAVALYVKTDADFYNCIMDAHQDTLFAHTGRQFYKNCYISGTVDFAFGAGTAFFEDCTLYAKKRAHSKSAVYTAQQRTSSQQTNGFVFLRGSLQCGAGVKGWLGRGWGKYARTIFIQTNMADCIKPGGWTTMGNLHATTTTFFAEYQCTGPGSNRAGRVSWSRVLTPAEAAFFSSKRNFIGRT